MNPNQIRKTALTLLCGIGLGYGAAVVNTPATLAAQDRKKEKTPQAFLSGGERAVIALEKISRQIETLDGRVENIESVLSGTNKTKK